jgi:hypothetical protein
MQDTEVVRQYALLGLTAFIEAQLAIRDKPTMIVVGQLEWFAILGCEATDEYRIGGVPVVPDMNIRSIVSFQ